MSGVYSQLPFSYCRGLFKYTTILLLQVFNSYSFSTNRPISYRLVISTTICNHVARRSSFSSKLISCHQHASLSMMSYVDSSSGSCGPISSEYSSISPYNITWILLKWFKSVSSMKQIIVCMFEIEGMFKTFLSGQFYSCGLSNHIMKTNTTRRHI